MSDWKLELETIFLADSQVSRAERENTRFVKFLREVVTPALTEIAEEMRRLGRNAMIREAPVSTILSISKDNNVEEICYSVTRQFVNDGILPRATVRVVRTNSRTTTHDQPFRADGEHYTLEDIGKEDIIRSFLSFYRMTKGQ